MRALPILLLLYPTIADIRYKKFYIEPVCILCLIFVFLRLIREPSEITAVFWGTLPGLFLWGIYKVTRGAVGFGDVVVVICLGMLIGWKQTGMLCLISFFLAGMAGLSLIVFRRGNRKSTIPFIPFLTVVFLLEWIVQ